jgi:hypothetical protein
VSEPVAAPEYDPAGERSAQLREGGLIVATLAVVGAVLGPVWELWSPAGPAGIMLPAGIQADESEAWAAADGRFALITAVVGLIAGALAWYLPRLRAVRGPWIALALAVGGIVGALLTDLVGWALRGGGKHYSCGQFTCIDHLPLSVQMRGLWFLEAFAAVLVYGLFVAFAVKDDLGRPDRPRNREREAGQEAEMPSGDQHSTLM